MKKKDVEEITKITEESHTLLILGLGSDGFTHHGTFYDKDSKSLMPNLIYLQGMIDIMAQRNIFLIESLRQKEQEPDNKEMN